MQGPAPSARVSTLELFFDLVFVFTITQVAHLVAHAHGALDLTKVPLGLTVGAIPQLALLVVLMVAMLAVEQLGDSPHVTAG